MTEKLLGIALTFILSACSGGQSSTAYVQSAREYLQSGAVAEAEIELKNALRTDGGNSEARFLLGKIHFESGELLAARKELELASAAAPASEKVIPILAKVYLGLAEHEALMAISGSGLSANSHATVLAAKGLSELANARLVAAFEYTQQATVIAPDSVYARVAHARVIASKGGNNNRTARAQLAKVFEQDKGYVLAWELLGDIEMAELNTDEAVKAYTEAIELGTNTVGDQFKRAIALINDGQFEAARKDVDALMVTHPKVLGVNYAQGLLHFREGKLKESIAHFDIALQNPSAWPQALFYAGTANMLLGNLEQAETWAVQYRTMFGESPSARMLLATIKIRKKNYAAAELLLEPVVDFSDNVEAKNLMVVALAGQSKHSEAAQVANDVVNLRPESAPANARAGASYYLSGDEGKTEAFLARAIELDDTYLYPVKLLSEAYLLIAQGERAVAVVETHIAKNPESTQAFILLARTELQLNKYAKSEQATRQALALAPNNLEGLQLQGDIALAQQQYSRAAEYFENMLAIDPASLDGLLSLAKIAGITQDFEKMEMWLAQAIESHPYKIQPRLVLARHFLVAGAAQRTITTLAGLPDGTPATAALLEVKARAYLQMMDFESAQYALHAALKQSTEAAELHFLMAQALAGQGNRPQAMTELELALTLAPEHSAARIFLANMFLAQKSLDEAATHLEILRGSVPEIQLHALEVDYALHRGDREGALRRSAVYFDELPSTASAITLAKSQFLVGQKNRAVQHLVVWLELHEGDIAARVTLAELYAATGATDKSLAQYDEALTRGGEDFAVLNNLAWLLRDSDPQKALQYALRAQAVDTNSVELMDTLVVLYINTGDTGAARKVLTKATALSPQNRSLLYRAAQLAHADGSSEQARRMLSALLEDTDNFRLRTEAELLYASLSDLRG